MWSCILVQLVIFANFLVIALEKYLFRFPEVKGKCVFLQSAVVARGFLACAKLCMSVVWEDDRWF